ncbi:MAG: FixH family protein [Deltaproteobacteria bacterium]|nr:FixH family protein [Deltaproteobacteria bacterium]
MTLIAALACTACGSDESEINSGAFEITAALESSPAAVGRNTLMVTLKDSAGAPVEGATLVVDPQMLMHGHGSTEQVVVSEMSAGVYKCTPLTFQMPGMWQVTIDAKKGELTGRKVFSFEVK